MYKLDLHTHTSEFNKILGKKINEKKYILKLLNRLFKIRGIIVLGIADYNGDSRYSAFVNATKLLPQTYTIDKKYKDYFIQIKKGNKKIYIIKTDEIETDKGHILVVGHKKCILNRKLKTVLREASRNHCPIIANHPLHKFGISHWLVFKLINETNPASINENDLKKHKSNFDAIEYNSYFPKDRKKLKKFSKKYKIPITASSDAHFLNELFSSYIKIDHLDFSNPQAFKRTLQHAFRKHFRQYAGTNGFFAIYKHGLQIIFEIFGKKLGIISKDL